MKRKTLINLLVLVILFCGAVSSEKRNMLNAVDMHYLCESETGVALSIRYRYDDAYFISFVSKNTDSDSDISDIEMYRSPYWPYPYSSGGAIIDNKLYIADQKCIYTFDLESKAFAIDDVLTELSKGSICAISDAGYLASLTNGCITIVNIRTGETRKRLHQGFCHAKDNRTELYWFSNILLAYCKDTKTFAVYYYDKDEWTIGDNVSYFSNEGGGYFCKSIVNKKGKIKNDYLSVQNNRIVSNGEESFHRIDSSNYQGWQYLRTQQNGIFEYWRCGKLVAREYRMQTDKRMLNNCVANFENYTSVLLSETHKIFFDFAARKAYMRRHNATGLIPDYHLATAAIQTENGYLPMLFADGTWLRMRVSDWQPENPKKHDNLAAKIVTAAPQKNAIAVWSGRYIYTLDNGGDIKEIYYSVMRDNIVSFEQGGTRLSVIDRDNGFVFMPTSWLKISLSAKQYETDLEKNKGKLMKRIGDTSSKRYRAEVRYCDKYSWQTHGFVGETGVFMAQDEKSLELCPAQPNFNVVRIPNTEKVRNSVWAGGIVVLGGTAMSLFDGTTVKLFDYDADTPVSAWKLPGLSHTVLCFTGDKAQEEKICAVNLAEKDESKRVIWLDTPIGTRWIARNGDELLLISSFGRLLGRMPIPEGIKEN